MINPLATSNSGDQNFIPLSDEERYRLLQEGQARGWEEKCGRCGACCGTVDGDPCENLQKDAQGKYFCAIYDHRFGLRKTVSGKPFLCVPIRDILHMSWPGDQCCGYKKKASL